MKYSYGSFTLHSVLLQQTQMPSFKLIRLEMTKLCSGLRTILTNFLIQWQTRCPFVKQSCPPYCHIDTGSGTVHLLISKEMIGKYQHHFRKEHGHTPNQFHKL